MVYAFTFDTIDYCNELQKGGFTRDQAEAQARVQSKIFSILIEDHLVTKSELNKNVQILLERDDKIEKSLNVLETSVTQVQKDIGFLRQQFGSLSDQFGTLRDQFGTLHEEVNRMDNKIQNLGLKLTIRLGSLMAVGITLLSVINKL